MSDSPRALERCVFANTLFSNSAWSGTAELHETKKKNGKRHGKRNEKEKKGGEKVSIPEV